MTTLHQKVEHLIGEWDGSDAADRSSKLDRLADEVIEVVQEELDTSRRPTRAMDPRPTPQSSAA